uniref:RRM domain-containing protein n=1 Tax=Guillardia theta TaxID=55529 RepID=A0A6U5Y147_GUITH|mmetsp:Transcript_19378/g.64100  ORF Transcript_19378/g.64100 Transcript_19378/m.64100 type:complete len:544 (+) Transcript_19378:91-1722(+)
MLNKFALVCWLSMVWIGGKNGISSSSPQNRVTVSTSHFRIMSLRGGGEGDVNGGVLSASSARALQDSRGFLKARERNLTRIDENCDQLQDVTRLDLSGNMLIDLGGFRNVHTITWLDASRNCFLTDKPLMGMGSLKVLNVGHNNISRLQYVGTCKQLRALIANNNEIFDVDELDYEGSLPFLESLLLSSNQFRKFPTKFFKHFPKLKKISLSHNRLSKFPEIQTNKDLQELRLAYNKIKEIPLGYFSSDLQILDLGHNRISNMSGIMALKGCKMLRNLNLAGNPICNVSSYRDTVINMCKRLEILDGKKLAEREGGKSSRGLNRKEDPREVFMSNLPYSASESDIKQFFSDLGWKAVVKIHLLRQRKPKRPDESLRSKGVAFVKFRTAELAERAILGFNNRSMGVEGSRGEGAIVRQIYLRPSWRDVHGKPTRKVEHSDEDEASDEMDTGDREAPQSADGEIEEMRSESPEASERVGQGSEQKYGEYESEDLEDIPTRVQEKPAVAHNFVVQDIQQKEKSEKKPKSLKRSKNLKTKVRTHLQK